MSVNEKMLDRERRGVIGRHLKHPAGIYRGAMVMNLQGGRDEN